MSYRYIIAIDQGTTGSTVLILSQQGEVLATAGNDFPQYYPQSGWVEHDAKEIWQSVLDALKEAIVLAGVSSSDCAGIGITNQRETTVLWDRGTGQPVHPAIVWQDRRTAELCQTLKDKGLEPLFRERTGLLLDPYFSGTKIVWLLENIAGLKECAQQGEVLFGTMDSFLVHCLSGGKNHVTDATNASRTLLYNLHQGKWDEDLAAHLGVPLTMLPQVCGNSEIVAYTQGVPGLKDGIPIAGMAGDQQAALFGQTCFDVGDAKCTYGTGAFLLINTGQTPVLSQHKMLTTVAWQIRGRRTYALEGSAFIAGAAVQWLRDGLCFIKEASEIDALARSVKDSGGVVFVPALTGLGAPYWNPHARGMLSGMTRDTSKAHIARATLEGIAFQIVDLAEAMQKEANQSMTRLRVDGGASMSALLMQFQADMLGLSIERPTCVETTALGAAYLAGLATGVFPSLEAIRQTHRIDTEFHASMEDAQVETHRKRWKKAIERVMLA